MTKYIDADALMEYLKQNWEPINDSFPMSFSLDQIKESLDEMPAADVEPVNHGKWLSTAMEDDCNEAVKYCSECHYMRPRNSWKGDFNYCPKCGAKIDGGSEE